jgi:hypothetical protein
MNKFGQMMLRAGLAAVALGVSALGAGSANAATITFDELAHTGFSTNHFVAVQSGGFSFSTNTPDYLPDFVVWGSAYDAYDAPGPSRRADQNGATLVNSGSAALITFSRIGGGAFNFNAIRLADALNMNNVSTGGGASGGPVDFWFTDANGTTAQSVLVDSLPGMEVFTFNRPNILSVAFKTGRNRDGSGIALGILQFDNVVVDEAIGAIGGVPEPASWALMLGGFALTGGALRGARRRGFVKPVLAQ